MNATKLLKLYDEYPDTERHSLIVENPDWENKITPALTEMGRLVDAGEWNIVTLARNVRAMIEIAYVMGYKKGQEK